MVRRGEMLMGVVLGRGRGKKKKKKNMRMRMKKLRFLKWMFGSLLSKCLSPFPPYPTLPFPSCRLPTYVPTHPSSYLKSSPHTPAQPSTNPPPTKTSHPLLPPPLNRPRYPLPRHLPSRPPAPFSFRQQTCLFIPAASHRGSGIR